MANGCARGGIATLGFLEKREMQPTRCARVVLVATGLLIGTWRAGPAQSTGEGPACTGWSDCNRGSGGRCTFERRPPYSGPVAITDYAEGVSGDGRGVYLGGAGGVRYSMVVLGNTGLVLDRRNDSVPNPRQITVNMSNPVPGGGGVPLGIITDNNDLALFTVWRDSAGFSPSLLSIPIGDSVPAAQMNVSFHIDGRFHVLQMGPLPYGKCHGTTRVHGVGTSSATILRASATKWVVDLPAGSIGRLFDVSHTIEHAVDRGLYYVRLHFEIGN